MESVGCLSGIFQESLENPHGNFLLEESARDPQGISSESLRTPPGSLKDSLMQALVSQPGKIGKSSRFIVSRVSETFKASFWAP